LTGSFQRIPARTGYVSALDRVFGSHWRRPGQGKILFSRVAVDDIRSIAAGLLLLSRNAITLLHRIKENQTAL